VRRSALASGASEVGTADCIRHVYPAWRAAYVTINHYRCDRGNLDQAGAVGVVVPSSGMLLTVSVPPPMRSFLGYCGPDDPGSMMSVSPIGASFSDTVGR
jgi:hypothetical protein